MKYRHLHIAAVTAALAALPAVAVAQSADVPPSSQLGWYIGAGGGLANADAENSSFLPPAGTAWNAPDSELAGKGFVGWRLHKHFGIELGYDYFGKFTNEYLGPAGAGVATSTVDGWVLDAVGYLPFTPNMSAIGRLGVVNGKLDTQLLGATPPTLAPISKRSTNFAWGLGAQFDINNRWALRAEYENFGSFGDDLAGKMRIDMWSASALIKF